MAAEGSQLLAFIKIELSDQVEELRTYLRSKGADISEGAGDEGDEASSSRLCDDMKQVISVCDACFADSTDADIESVLNSIVSIVTVSVPGHDELLALFSSKLAACESHQAVVLKVLKLLFSSVNKSSASMYHVYHSLLSVAGKVNQVDSVFSSATEMSATLGDHVSTEQKQTLLRLVYRELLANKRSEAASRVMVDLLSTYTEDTASQAVEEARSCVLAALADPHILLFDYLTALKPVRQLQDTPLHQLLSVFASGTLTDYQSLYDQHRQLIESWGLNHELNLAKMRQLTFLQLAETNATMTFDFLQKTLQLPHDGDADQAMEQFLITVMRTRMVRGRMDQVRRCVHVSYTTPRVLAADQWSRLKSVLVGWKSRVNSTRQNLLSVATAQTGVVGV